MIDSNDLIMILLIILSLIILFCFAFDDFNIIRPDDNQEVELIESRNKILKDWEMEYPDALEYDEKTGELIEKIEQQVKQE